ncbi:MAG: hypothetical protein JWM77_52 [Rhodospirillales bacterium]|nr:hypothetical protein [Rhodospirillales bacterium]
MNENTSRSNGRAADHPLDAMVVSQNNHAVLLENESVRVLDTWVGAGQRTAIHSHEWPSTLYVLSWSDFVRYDIDGTVLVDSRKMPSQPGPGAVLWSAPLPPHYVENVGGGDLRVIAVELKGG